PSSRKKSTTSSRDSTTIPMLSILSSSLFAIGVPVRRGSRRYRGGMPRALSTAGDRLSHAARRCQRAPTGGRPGPEGDRHGGAQVPQAVALDDRVRDTERAACRRQPAHGGGGSEDHERDEGRGAPVTPQNGTDGGHCRHSSERVAGGRK